MRKLPVVVSEKAKTQRLALAVFGAIFGLAITGFGIFMEVSSKQGDEFDVKQFISLCRDDSCQSSYVSTPLCFVSQGILKIGYDETYHNAPSTPYEFRSTDGRLIFQSDNTIPLANIRSCWDVAQVWSLHSPLKVKALIWKGKVIAFYKPNTGAKQDILTRSHPLYGQRYIQDRKSSYIFFLALMSLGSSAMFYGIAVKHGAK